MWDEIPSLSSIGGLLADAAPGWLLAAVAAEIVALLAFSMLQRRLVVDLGGDLTGRGSMELTLASGALSMALPAGTALGAGYTYRRLRRAGLRAPDVGVTMVASAGVLTGALLLLYLVFAGPSLLDDAAGLIAGNELLTISVIALTIVAGTALWARPSAGSRTVPTGRLAAMLQRSTRTFAATVRTIPFAGWRATSGWALLKWVADFAVLLCAAQAVGATVDLVAVATVYLGVQALRQVPFTPGGLGVIDAALLAGLIAAGATAAPAAAAVVIYRVLTFWLVLPAGAVAAGLDRAPQTVAAAVPAVSVVLAAERAPGGTPLGRLAAPPAGVAQRRSTSANARPPDSRA